MATVSDLARIGLFGVYVISQCFPSVILPVPALMEYCQWETFNASCPGPDQVIVVDAARYGRMRFGRCMREDHGSVGCSADVRDHIDRKCSGRRRCQLLIPDAVLHAAHPCPKELMPYLEASYSCVPVKAGSIQSCAVFGGQPVSPDFGFLSSLTTIESSGQLGASNCPWLIDARPGQRVNLTLFNFASHPPSSSTSSISSASVTVSSEADCSRRDGWTIVVQEYNTTVEFPECATSSMTGSGSRERLIYTSRGSSVQIYFRHAYIADLSPVTGDPPAAPPSQVLLRFQVFGCADVPEVVNAVSRRHGDTMVVRCNNGGPTYVLTCSEDRWKGDTANCSRGASIESPERHELKAGDAFPYGLVVVIGVGVLMGLVFGVILLFGILVCLRRRRATRQFRSQTADDLFSPPTIVDEVEELRPANLSRRLLRVDNGANTSIYLQSTNMFTPSTDNAFESTELPPPSSTPLCHYHRYIRSQLGASAQISGTLPSSPKKATFSIPSYRGDSRSAAVRASAIVATSYGGNSYVIDGDSARCHGQHERPKLSARSQVDLTDHSHVFQSTGGQDVDEDPAVTIKLVEATAVRRTRSGLVAKSSELGDFYTFCSFDEPENTSTDFIY